MIGRGLRTALGRTTGQLIAARTTSGFLRSSPSVLALYPPKSNPVNIDPLVIPFGAFQAQPSLCVSWVTADNYGDAGVRIKDTIARSAGLALRSKDLVRFDTVYINAGYTHPYPFDDGRIVNGVNSIHKVLIDVPGHVKMYSSEFPPGPRGALVYSDVMNVITSPAVVEMICNGEFNPAQPTIHTDIGSIVVMRHNTLGFVGGPPNGSARITFNPGNIFMDAPVIVPLSAAGAATWDAADAVWPIAATINVYDGAGATGNMVREWHFYTRVLYGGDVLDVRIR